MYNKHWIRGFTVSGLVFTARQTPVAVYRIINDPIPGHIFDYHDLKLIYVPISRILPL